MGMYDTVRLEYEIPGIEEKEWQTKSLDCCLDQYRITQEGDVVFYDNEWNIWVELVAFTGQLELKHVGQPSIVFEVEHGVVKGYEIRSR